MKKEKIKLEQITVNSFLTIIDQSTIQGGTFNTIVISAKYKCFPVPQPVEPLPETPYRGTSDTICNCDSNPYCNVV